MLLPPRGRKQALQFSSHFLSGLFVRFAPDEANNGLLASEAGALKRHCRSPAALCETQWDITEQFDCRRPSIDDRNQIEAYLFQRPARTARIILRHPQQMQFLLLANCAFRRTMF